MQKAFRNVLVIAIIGVIIFGVFSYINGNGNTPKQLSYSQFVEKLDKGDLKTLEIQPEQNVYLVSGKTKMMKIILQRFYTITKRFTKITSEARSQKGLDFTVKEEEKQSVFVSMLTTLIPVLIIAFLFIFFLSQAQGGGGGGRMMNFGKSKAKMYDNQNVVFASQMLLGQTKKNKS